MKKMHLIWVVLAGFLCLNLPGQMIQSGEPDLTVGEKLERQIWADMKAKNWDAVAQKLAAGFQSVHQDGSRDRATELKLIQKLNLGDYTLNDFQVTRNGENLIVTYFVTVDESIAGKRLSKKPAARLSVWSKNAGGWQWITHANLNPLK